MSATIKQRSAGPRLLVTDRNSCMIIERSKVHVDGGRVVYHAADPNMIKRFNIPHCNLAVLLLGQGTSITQDAMQKLSDEGVMVAFTGSGGAPIFSGNLISYKSTEYFRRMLPIYNSLAASLSAAKEIMRIRVEHMATIAETLEEKSNTSLVAAGRKFIEEIEAADNHPRLMAAEGDYAKSCYLIFSQHAKVEGFTRKPGADLSSTRIGVMNRMIDYGSYLAYGIAGTALWALGIPVHMSIMHGKTRAGGLVFDIADAWKNGVVIPAAAKHSATGDEKGFREHVLKTIDDKGMLAFSIRVVDRIICAGEKDMLPSDNDLRYPKHDKNPSE